MKLTDWGYRPATERRYQDELRQAGRHLARTVKGLETIQEITSALLGYTKDPKWQEYANQEARKMVRSVLVGNAQTWREAARKGQHSHEIHTLLKREFAESKPFNEIIQENAGLIKTLPSDFAKQASNLAAKYALEGKRSGDIIKAIHQEFPDFAEYKAKRIARTEVAKAQATVTKVRSQQMGIDWYIWQTSHDQRVRSSHDLMQGVLCRFSNPPSPEALAGIKSTLGHYGPGECPNCRCYAEPVIDIDFLTFPLQVYDGGKIVRMTKRKFLEVA